MHDVLRILDANANRAAEGLRVVEEYARFVLDDPFLTEQFKLLRHDLTTALAVFPFAARQAVRDTQADVGTHIAAPAESRRGDLFDVVAANLERTQQALRCLEEYAKLDQGAVAAACERLRYRTYTLAKALSQSRDSAARLANARLYVLIDGRRSPEEFERRAEQLVAAGADVLQLRDKQLDDRTLLDRARRLRRLTRGTSTLFVMNDRPDLARLAAADGVHVGQEELSVRDVRSIVGSEMLVGVSTHSLEQARAAVLDGASYIGCGPTFPSGTKSFAQFPGLAFLRTVAAEIRLPAFAIGGLDPDNVPSVLATGFTRVAVSGCVANAADPPAVVARLRALLALPKESGR